MKNVSSRTSVGPSIGLYSKMKKCLAAAIITTVSCVLHLNHCILSLSCCVISCRIIAGQHVIWQCSPACCRSLSAVPCEDRASAGWLGSAGYHLQQSQIRGLPMVSKSQEDICRKRLQVLYGKCPFALVVSATRSYCTHAICTATSSKVSAIVLILLFSAPQPPPFPPFPS